MIRIEEKLKLLADEDRLHHAYLFFGPESAPKEDLALSLARHLEGSDIFQDTLLFEHAAVGINEVRNIKKFLFQTPLQSKKRTLIIRDAERLTWQAAPALLKIVEEPPTNSLIIFTARDTKVLSPALLSRCIRIYVPPAINMYDSHPEGAKRLKDPLEETPNLVNEIEQSMIDLYRKDKIKNARKIGFLLRKLEMSRFNLNPKLQKKAIDYILRS
ncbi:MAG: hypothetical protein Q8R20_01175 [Nanoarchaeota archaeon]|nr:hypothetical protein [Nanoarchaeota archaeon]